MSLLHEDITEILVEFRFNKTLNPIATKILL